MFSVVATIGSSLDNGAGRGAISTASGAMSTGSIEHQIQEAERTLERLRRDLALAQARAEQQQQKLSDARRHMEQWRWVNAINQGDPEAIRLAAVSFAAQTRIVDVAVKNNADVLARIERLQNRIERQIARYFDLQSRRRIDGGEKPNDRSASTGLKAASDQASIQGVRSQDSDSAKSASNNPLLRRYGMIYSGYLLEKKRV
jgi:hypothetical protein